MVYLKGRSDVTPFVDSVGVCSSLWRREANQLLFVAVILGICREKGSTDANLH